MHTMKNRNPAVADIFYRNFENTAEIDLPGHTPHFAIYRLE